MDLIKVIINFLKNIFTKKNNDLAVESTAEVIIKPQEQKPVDTQVVIPEKKNEDLVKIKIPSRDEVLRVLFGLIDGDIKNKIDLPYKLIREDKGKNRSRAIDELIKKQGGSLGEPYCQYGQQDVLDELCRYFSISRKNVEIPEGGGTQRVWGEIPLKYRQKVPSPVCWVYWRNFSDKSKGHVGMVLSYPISKNNYKTFEFNTTASGSEVVRDGEGAAYCDRVVGDTKTKELLGFVDIYQALIDAIGKG